MLRGAALLILVPVAPGCRAASHGTGLGPAAVVTCPSVALTISPADGEIQGTAGVSVGSFERDPSSPATYRWTASDGYFDDVSSATTTYECPRSRSGPQTITVTASRGPCSVNQEIVVICAAPALDSGATGGWSGLGVGAAAPDGGSGDAGDGAGSDGSQSDGGPDGASLICAGGDSTIDEGPVCNACTLANCTTVENAKPPKVPVLAGCHHLTSDADRERCEALYCCLRASHCVAAGGDPTPCWCGDSDPAQCALGAQPANGPCLAEFQAAAGSDDPAQIATLLVDPSQPVGGAVNLAVCRATFCADPPSPACSGF